MNTSSIILNEVVEQHELANSLLVNPYAESPQGFFYSPF